MTDQNSDMSNVNNAALDIDFDSQEFKAQAAAWAAEYFAEEAEADELYDYVTEEQFGCFCTHSEDEGFLPCCPVEDPCNLHYKVVSKQANWNANVKDFQSS